MGRGGRQWGPSPAAAGRWARRTGRQRQDLQDTGRANRVAAAGSAGRGQEPAMGSADSGREPAAPSRDPGAGADGGGVGG